MAKDKNNSSNSLVFGQWPQTKMKVGAEQATFAFLLTVAIDIALQLCPLCVLSLKNWRQNSNAASV